MEFCRRHPDATFAFMGHRSMFDELFGAIPAGQTDVHPFGDQEEHLRFTGGLHVGLAPMTPSPFNASRSDTRVCVYAGHGVAAVLEDAPAHRPHADHARIYRTTDELLATLEELHADRGRVEDLARARARVAGARAQRRGARAPARPAYRGLLTDVGRGAPADPPAPPDRRRPRAPPRRRVDREPEEALALSRELVAEAPGYDQAHLLAVRCLETLGRPRELLDHVDRLTPSPVYADVFAELAVRAARRARPATSGATSTGSARRSGGRGSPTSGPPAAQSRAVLEHQPYDHFALASTIHRLRRDDPASPELDALYERACLVAPQEVPADRRPARLARSCRHERGHAPLRGVRAGDRREPAAPRSARVGRREPPT